MAAETVPEIGRPPPTIWPLAVSRAAPPPVFGPTEVKLPPMYSVVPDCATALTTPPATVHIERFGASGAAATDDASLEGSTLELAATGGRTAGAKGAGSAVTAKAIDAELSVVETKSKVTRKCCTNECSRLRLGSLLDVVNARPPNPLRTLASHLGFKESSQHPRDS